MILQIQKLKQLFNLQDYPCSITANGTKATITLVNHNFKDGDTLTVTGTGTVMDGDQLVTRLNNNSLEFLTTYSGTKTGIIKQNDEQLNSIIALSESFIKSFCEVEYGNTAEASEVYDFTSSGIINLKRGNVIESDIKSIKISSSNNFTDSNKHITLTSEDYFVYDTHIELKLEKCVNYLGLITARKAVKITYTTQPVPEAIKKIATQIAEFYFRIDNEKSIILDSQTTINGDQRTYSKDIPQKILSNLYPFKRVSIGEPY